MAQDAHFNKLQVFSYKAQAEQLEAHRIGNHDYHANKGKKSHEQ